MKDKDFKKLLKEYKENPKRIIYLYIDGKINLYSKQLKQVINMKNEMEI